MKIFLGANQNKVSTEFLQAALRLGSDRVEVIQVEKRGKNALDFVIACYLGRDLEKTPGHECLIVSKDKGFDPLVQHLVENKFRVRRVETLVVPRPAVTWEDAVEWLAATEKARRPRKREGLVKHLFQHFSRKLPEAEIEGFIAQMIKARKLEDRDGKLTYHF